MNKITNLMHILISVGLLALSLISLDQCNDISASIYIFAMVYNINQAKRK